MNATTPAANLAATLAVDVPYDKYGKWIDAEDGSRFRAKMEADTDASPFDHNNRDNYGQLHWTRERQRPAACDGAAVKMDTRDGPVWWQPPRDVVKDWPQGLPNLRERVQDYLHDSWSFVVLAVECESPPCKCCGQRKRNVVYCGGVESDAGAEHYAELIRDMVSDLQPEVTV